MISHAEVVRLFDEVVNELNQENWYLASEVTKLGYPTLSTQIPTAGVAWDGDKKKIIFLFNPNFLERIKGNMDELKFTIIHECSHIFRSHIFLIRDELEKMKKLNKTNGEMRQFQRKINIAADCVVNDSLVNLYDLPKVFTDAKKIKIFYGQETVGVDCEDLTAMDVYYLLPEDQQQQQQEGQGQQEGTSSEGVENHEQWETFFNGDGTINKDFVDTIKKFVEDNIQNSSLSDGEAETIDNMKEKMKDSTDAYASQAGRTALGQKRPVDGLGKETLNWNKILFQFVEIIKQEDVWTKPNRKLQSVYPEIILPSLKNTEKEKIFVAIDTSGSIDYNALKLFLTVVKNTPKRFDIEAITFDDACYPYDMKKGDQPVGGGGTNFYNIEQYIKQNLKKYPKAIFVLTDGIGNHVNPEHPERWCWILYGYAETTYCANMKHYNIRDLLR